MYSPRQCMATEEVPRRMARPYWTGAANTLKTDKAMSEGVSTAKGWRSQYFSRTCYTRDERVRGSRQAASTIPMSHIIEKEWVSDPQSRIEHWLVVKGNCDSPERPSRPSGYRPPAPCTAHVVFNRSYAIIFRRSSKV